MGTEVALAKGLIGEGKLRLNRLMSERVRREAALKELTAQWEVMQREEARESDPADVMLQLEAELEETMQGLKNESYYEETLTFMIESRRLSLRACSGPILRLKSDLAAFNQETSITAKQEMEAQRTLAQSLKEIDRFQSQQTNRQQENRSRLNSEKESYKNKQKLLFFLQQEHETTKEYRKQQNIQRRIVELEKDLNHLQGNNGCRRRTNPRRSETD